MLLPALLGNVAPAPMVLGYHIDVHVMLRRSAFRFGLRVMSLRDNIEDCRPRTGWRRQYSALCNAERTKALRQANSTMNGG